MHRIYRIKNNEKKNLLMTLIFAFLNRDNQKIFILFRLTRPMYTSSWFQFINILFFHIFFFLFIHSLKNIFHSFPSYFTLFLSFHLFYYVHTYFFFLCENFTKWSHFESTYHRKRLVLWYVHIYFCMTQVQRDRERKSEVLLYSKKVLYEFWNWNNDNF